MSRLPAIDESMSLADVLRAEDLDEIATRHATLHHVGIAIVSKEADLAVSAGGADQRAIAAEPGESGPLIVGDSVYQRAGLIYSGELLGIVAVGPCALASNDAKHASLLSEHIAGLLEQLVHMAYARQLTTSMHLAAMQEAYDSLEAKNEQLSLAVERMQELDRMKTNFLATVSHELRTPLTSVIGYSEMLLEGLAGELNEEQSDYVQTVLSKADQLLQLITGILDAQLIETGEMRLVRSPVVLHDVIESVVATFLPGAQKRGIELSVPVAAVPRVAGDARKIRQVLWNLVANAVKFTPDGGLVDVVAEVGPLLPRKDAGKFGEPSETAELGVRLVVKDSGIGISLAKQQHIFEPFFQVDSSSTREYGGTGLGLTLAKRYVEAHGGSIWVDSQLGRGSEFTVSFPAVPEDLEAYVAEHPEIAAR